MTASLPRTALCAALPLLSAGCVAVFGNDAPPPLRFHALPEWTTATVFYAGDSINGVVATEDGVQISMPVRVTNVSGETTIVTSCPNLRLVTADGTAAIQDYFVCAEAIGNGVVLEPGDSWATTAVAIGCFAEVSIGDLGEPCHGEWLAEQVSGSYRWFLTYGDEPWRMIANMTSPAFSVIDPRMAVGASSRAP